MKSLMATNKNLKYWYKYWENLKAGLGGSQSTFGVFQDRSGGSQGYSGGLRVQSGAASLLILFWRFELKD